MARSRKNKARYEGDEGTLSSNPFAALGLSGEEEESPEEDGTESSAPSSPSANPLDAPKLVVRKERKGRGGKTVTLIEGFVTEGALLDDLAKTLKKSLGCSGRAVGATIELGGARQDQVATWLRESGARRVVVGN